MNLTIESRDWVRVGHCAVHMLGDKAKLKEFPPTTCSLDIIPNKTVTFICFIAADNTWRKQTVDLCHIGECDI